MLTQSNVESLPHPQSESEHALGNPVETSNLPLALQSDEASILTISHVRDVIQQLVSDGTLLNRLPDLTDSQILLIGELAAASAAEGKNEVTRALRDRGMIFKLIQELRQLNRGHA